MNQSVKVYGSSLLVKPIKEEQSEEVTKSGIITALGSKSNYQKGEVIRKGSGYISGGKEFPLPIEKGTIIVFEKFEGKAVMIGGEEYRILDFENVLYSYDGTNNDKDDYEYGE